MFKRPILRNEEGASPGGAAPTQTPASPAASNGAAPAAPTFDPSLIKSAVTEAFGELRNGLFADLRKAGALKQEKAQPAQAAQPQEATGTTSSGLSQADVANLIARERAFSRAIGSVELTEEQSALIDETFRAVNPPDPHAWATGFLKTLGIGKKNATPTQPNQIDNNKQAPSVPATNAQPAQSAQPATNISDKGPSASSAARDPEAVIRHRITEATNDDFDRLVAQHGRTKALDMWAAETRAQLRSIKLVPPNRQR